MAEWVRRRETTRQLSSTAKILSMEADKHRLSDQVGQLQSKLDRAALHRDLIVGVELQKQNPRVSGYQNGQVAYKPPAETPDEIRFRLFGVPADESIHRKRTVWKGPLMDPVGQALQGSKSRRGSHILEGPG